MDLGAGANKGQVIAQIEHTELDAQLAQAKAKLQAAQAKQHTIAAQGRAGASCHSTSVEIVGGLSPGVPVIVSGQELLAEGDRVGPKAG